MVPSSWGSWGYTAVPGPWSVSQKSWQGPGPPLMGRRPGPGVCGVPRHQAPIWKGLGCHALSQGPKAWPGRQCRTSPSLEERRDGAHARTAAPGAWAGSRRLAGRLPVLGVQGGPGARVEQRQAQGRAWGAEQGKSPCCGVAASRARGAGACRGLRPGPWVRQPTESLGRSVWKPIPREELPDLGQGCLSGLLSLISRKAR